MGILSTLNTKPATLRQQIVEAVQTLIFEGELHPGDHVREQMLTERLGVSRTPIREAFIILERDGLVVNYPNRGIFVRQFDEADVCEIFALRVWIESLAARQVINRLDERHFGELRHLIDQQRLAIAFDDRKQLGPLDQMFHLYFIVLTENSRLISFWRSIRAQLSALFYYRRFADPTYDDQQILVDHGRILEAYRSGEVEAVERAHQEINTRVERQIIEALRIFQAD